jgi:hypothetical protein
MAADPVPAAAMAVDQVTAAATADQVPVAETAQVTQS